jgi:hypothetical protein
MTLSDDYTNELTENEKAHLEDLRMEFAIIAVRIRNLVGTDAVLEDLRALVHMIEQQSGRSN